MSKSLFVLQNDWEVTTLAEACNRGGGEIQTGPFGSQLHASDYVLDGIPSIMPQNIGDNRINEQGIARITSEDAYRLSRYLVREGDIVYSRRGDVERKALVRSHEDGWLCGTGCLRVRFGNETSINPLYASFYLSHPDVRKWIVQHAHGATMPNLNTSILGALPFVIPSADEQHHIAHILGTLDDKIELSRQLNATLEQLARAIFQSWFVDFDPVRAKASGESDESICRRLGLTPELLALFPAALEDSVMGEIPVGWKINAVDELANRVAMGPFGSSIKVSTFVPEGVPVISGQHLRTFMLEDSTFNFVTEEHAQQLNKAAVQRGDIVFTHAGNIGQVALIPNNSQYDRYILSQRQFFLRPNPLLTSGNYLTYHFSSALGQHQLLANASSSGVPSIARPVSYLRSIKVLSPSKSILDKFDKVIAPIHSSIETSRSEAKTLVALRDELLPKLLSGDLRLK
ncbi:restriction endonuclease subunit S [Hymenobacter setariae]|uniref:Restriction endonuclease subunit S n=1 Tax=Hymenobacter setariae TaxID=2594794 RepID=A0A558BMY0_9BACT|nr:restriction endonuclease subunit S [Hymenobacter setariae]TVT37860.1 restriction endonuclease subunit S [Hymenobacter setariae]